MRVQAEYQGVYYAAEIVTVAKGKAKAKAPVKVSFVGHEGSQEWVGGDRLRSKALKATTKEAPKAKAGAKAKAEPKGKAKAKEYDYSELEKGMRLQVEADGKY